MYIETTVFFQFVEEEKNQYLEANFLAYNEFLAEISEFLKY